MMPWTRCEAWSSSWESRPELMPIENRASSATTQKDMMPKASTISTRLKARDFMGR